MAEAKKPTKLQMSLPSEVKKVKAAPKKTAKKSAPRKNISQAPANWDAEPVLQAEKKDNGLSPFDDKYVSKTVHFAASAAPVPEEYDCDSSQELLQMQEAESKAIAKCEANGEQHCRLHEIKIVKAGELRCQDIPGRDCGVKKFYRGCVAQAIVVGGDEPEAQASVF